MRGEKGLALTLPHKLRVFCAVVREVDRRLVVCAVLGPQSGRLGGFEGREGSSSSGSSSRVVLLRGAVVAVVVAE